MNKILGTIVLVVVMNACATLTKSQIKSVNQFATSSDSFSKFPSQILISLNDIRTKRSVFFANSIQDNRLHINILDSIDLNRRLNLKIATKADITFKIIDKYAQTLALISSDKFEKNFQKQINQFGQGIEELISEYNTLETVNQLPTGIGDPINKVLSFSGNHLIRIKQAKVIKEFVPKADVLIDQMLKNVILFLEKTTLDEMIEHEEKNIRRNYLSFLNQSDLPSVMSDMHYLKLKEQIHEVKQLRLYCIRSTKSLGKAHKKLALTVLKKKKIKELYLEFQHFFENVKELKTSFEKLKK